MLRPYAPPHMSHSAAVSYLRCPKSYELERLSGMQAVPAWWFLGGSAVHNTTETYDRLIAAGSNVTLEVVEETFHRIFDELVEQERIKKPGIPYEQWFAAGRWPKKNGYDWWREHGPGMCTRYVKWRQATSWDIADFNGVPGIECDLKVTLEFGELRGAPDRVFRLPSGQLVVGDVKSGSTLPKEPLQLGGYANDLEVLGFERPAYGTYIMVKQDPNDIRDLHTPLVPLDKYTTPYLEGVYGSAHAAISVGAFSPNVGDACRQCVVQKGCYAVGGEESAKWDRLHPEYRGD